MKWDRTEIPDQTGRVAVVTGANSGIGFETARALALKGAHVVLACRSEERGTEALERIAAEEPKGTLEFSPLDLGELASVRAFAERTLAAHDRLDLLVLNAGVMMPPYGKTADGFELQIGVNYLGHFALTGLLLDRVLGTEGARVVHVSSMAHKFGTIDFDDLHFERKYRRNPAYGQSKLANLLFAYELQRRLDAAGKTVLSVAAHPGWTATELQRNVGLFSFMNPMFGQSIEMGALPTLYAATAEDVEGGQYFGPDSWFGWRGGPALVKSNAKSHDEEVAAKLWAVAEELTGVSFLSAAEA